MDQKDRSVSGSGVLGIFALIAGGVGALYGGYRFGGWYEDRRHQKRMESYQLQQEVEAQAERERAATREEIAELRRQLVELVTREHAAVAKIEEKVARKASEAVTKIEAEAKKAEEQRQRHYQRREETRDRRFAAHEEGRSEVAAQSAAQRDREVARKLADVDAHLEPIRQHSDYLDGVLGPARAPGQAPSATSEAPPIADVYAELDRYAQDAN